MVAVAQHPELELHGLVVLRDGETVLERHWAPYLADDLALVYSVSKTFTATAVGLAIADGHFGLDTPVVNLLAPPSCSADITVHHLLSMSTGHTTDTLEALDGVPPADWTRTLLAVEPKQPVGSCHVYNNGASFLLRAH